MSIWQKKITLAEMNQFCLNSAVSHLGIEFCEQGENWLLATMPVDQRTQQPMGFLHGGISAALAETVASMAGFCATDNNQAVVGIELNISHLRPVQKGVVTARAEAIRLGKKLQFWQVEIYDQQQQLCCISRLTLSVILQ